VAIRPREKKTNYAVFVLLFVLSGLALEASIGPSFFQNRYVLFILPLYLLLALCGWFLMKRPVWRRAGIILIFLILGCSLVYYYVDYYQVHYYFAFARPLPLAGPNEGHSLSTTAKDLESRLQEDEVIIHFSHGTVRIRSYFAALHYHQRRLPEYLYAKEGVPEYNGRQYLRPGEWIASLQDLPRMPSGIWLVTLSFSESILGDYPPRWVRDGNLPGEMRLAGYQRIETFQHGNVTVNHFRRLDVVSE
jgi:hypothetical protein